MPSHGTHSTGAAATLQWEHHSTMWGGHIQGQLLWNAGCELKISTHPASATTTHLVSWLHIFLSSRIGFGERATWTFFFNIGLMSTVRICAEKKPSRTKWMVHVIVRGSAHQGATSGKTWASVRKSFLRMGLKHLGICCCCYEQIWNMDLMHPHNRLVRGLMLVFTASG